VQENAPIAETRLSSYDRGWLLADASSPSKLDDRPGSAGAAVIRVTLREASGQDDVPGRRNGETYPSIRNALPFVNKAIWSAGDEQWIDAC
jgi:hypothetical protein